MTIEQRFIFVPVCAVGALLFAFIQARSVLKFPEGSDVMREISAAIREGANAYLKRQYKLVGLVFAIIFVILGVMAFLGYLNLFVEER